MKPFSLLKNDDSKKFVELFIKMGDISNDIDIDTTSEFVCRMYGQYKNNNVNEARYKKLLEMSGGAQQVSSFRSLKTYELVLVNFHSFLIQIITNYSPIAI